MKPWIITWRGYAWTDADALVGHLAAVNELGFEGWASVSPWGSPQLLAAWVSALLAAETGEDLAVCVAHVAQAPLGELLACLTEPEQGPDADAD